MRKKANSMRKLLIPLLALIAACSPKEEEEQEPDYENIVLEDEEEWNTDEQKDRKFIVKDLPDPQEQVILEIPDQETR
jgi:hypothetical protein